MNKNTWLVTGKIKLILSELIGSGYNYIYQLEDQAA